MRTFEQVTGKGSGVRWTSALVAVLAALVASAFGPGVEAVRSVGAEPVAAEPAAEREPLHLVLLHTNDVHGQALPRRATWIEDRELWVGGIERASAYIESVRRREGADRVLLVDGGDWFQGTPEGRVRGGREFTKLLARLDYDAMAVGNHEFDLGLAPLLALLLETEVPSVCANLYEAGGDERVGWVRPFRVVERAGLRIAFVGLIAPSTPDITHEDARRLVFTDPVAEFAKVRDELPDDVDLIVPLTHNGLYLDRELAAAYPELPLVVGGHSHTYLAKGVQVGDTRIVQAGDKCTVVGRVDLYLDPVTKRVERTTARLIDLDREADPDLVDLALASAVEALVSETDAVMSVVVGRLDEAPSAVPPFESGALGNWIADAMREFARADVGLHNRGGIRSSLGAGEVTRRDLFQVCPFGNTVVSFEMTGAELEACLRGSVESRSTVRIEISGAEVVVRHVDDEARPLRVVEVRVGGEPIDPERRYRMATNSFLATGGDRIFGLERELDVLDTGVLINDLLEQRFPENGGLVLPADNRFPRAR